MQSLMPIERQVLVLILPAAPRNVIGAAEIPLGELLRLLPVTLAIAGDSSGTDLGGKTGTELVIFFFVVFKLLRGLSELFDMVCCLAPTAVNVIAYTAANSAESRPT